MTARSRPRAVLGDVSNQAPLKNSGKATCRSKTMSRMRRRVSKTTEVSVSRQKTTSTKELVRVTRSRSAARLFVESSVNIAMMETCETTRNFVFSDIDIDDENEDCGFAEYCNDIYDHMRANEVKHHAGIDFLSTTTRDISHKMRAILVDWLVEVTEEYQLSQQTLFLTVNLVDAYLRRSDLPRKSLQLLGVACMLIASKFEEIHPPTARDFSYITDYTYNTSQVVAMEEKILDVLRFDIAIVTSWEFRRRFILAIEKDHRVLSLMSYYMELTLQFPVSTVFKPSILAAAALSLAQITLNLPKWSSSLAHNTGYEYDDIRSCVVCLNEMMWVVSSLEESKRKAVTEKYRKAKYSFVGKLNPPNHIP